MRATFISSLFAGLAFTATAATQSLPSLPEPVSNNAVALVNVDGTNIMLSFMGLGANKDHLAVHNRVWALTLPNNEQANNSVQWQPKKAVPGLLELKGRLASTAVGLGQYAYIFGGYTVAKDHSEISSPDVLRYDVKTNTYQRLAPMPVPVDDSVALTYASRYIYLISGWHNDGNVNLVQVYDTQTNQWQQASPFLGQPVFGQAAAISGNTMLVCDGVTVVAHENKRRDFKAVPACYRGQISAENPAKIDWRIVPHPTKIARYRMAATAVGDTLYFIGGSPNPYNYNGIGYDGKPSPASNAVWRYNIKRHSWTVDKQASSPATMDHRGLLLWKSRLWTLGGMNNQQQVISAVYSHPIVNKP